MDRVRVLIPNYYQNIANEDMMLGGITGMVIGDAVGLPYKYEKRGHFIAHDISGDGVLNMPRGAWSDTSGKSLCLLESLANLSTIPPDYSDIARKYYKHYKTGYWSASGKVFVINEASQSALTNRFENGKQGRYIDLSRYSHDNGALMSIFPIAFYLHHLKIEYDTWVDIVYSLTDITHKNIRSKMVCHFYIGYCLELMTHKGNKFALYKEHVSKFKAYYSSKEELLTPFERLLNQDIRTLEEKDIKSSNNDLDDLEASLWCFLTCKNYSTSVLKAVNLGGETNVLAALTGAMAGLYYGVQSVPIKWKKALMKSREVFVATQTAFRNLNAEVEKMEREKDKKNSFDDAFKISGNYGLEIKEYTKKQLQEYEVQSYIRELNICVIDENANEQIDFTQIKRGNILFVLCDDVEKLRKYNRENQSYFWVKDSETLYKLVKIIAIVTFELNVLADINIIELLMNLYSGRNRYRKIKFEQDYKEVPEDADGIYYAMDWNIDQGKAEAHIKALNIYEYFKNRKQHLVYSIHQSKEASTDLFFYGIDIKLEQSIKHG